MTKARRGIYAAAITPFRADGSVDQAKAVAYASYLLSEGGCDGVAPMGTTGEGTSIAMPDRLALPSAYADAGIAPDRVIFGAGAAATGDAILLARAALAAGFPNILVLPPFYYKSPDEEGLYAYYSRLIEAVGDGALRLYLYHFPAMSAVPIPPTLAARLKAEFGPMVAGLKDSSGDMAGMRAFVDATGGAAEDFDVYPSSETLYFEGIDMGCAGVISGTTNAFARLIQKARAAQGPDREKLMARVLAARDIAAKYPIIQAMKEAEVWRSGDEDWARMAPPLVPMGAKERAALREDLKALGLVPPSV